MKKISIIILTLLPLLTLAQKDTLVNKNLGINISSAFISSENLFVIPHLTYSFNNHNVSIGPTFTLFDRKSMFVIIGNADTKPTRSFKFNGLYSSYQFFPSIPKNLFNFYFQFEFIYHQFFINEDGLFPYFRERNFEQFLAFGLRTNITKSFYINTNGGAGLLYSATETINRTYEATEPNWILKLGIGVLF